MESEMRNMDKDEEEDEEEEIIFNVCQPLHLSEKQGRNRGANSHIILRWKDPKFLCLRFYFLHTPEFLFNLPMPLSNLMKRR